MHTHHIKTLAYSVPHSQCPKIIEIEENTSEGNDHIKSSIWIFEAVSVIHIIHYEYEPLKVPNILGCNFFARHVLKSFNN